MKLLSSEPNPASIASSNSPPRKRTRDLPNMFDCHCCGRHADRDSPKDRPQVLESVWRIVLLCKKCRKAIQSGETCSYCFQATGTSGDLCECTVCGRKIHKDCVRCNGDHSPWRYSGAELDRYGVCVDCWVPNSLKNSSRVCRRSSNERRLKSRTVNKHLSKVEKNAQCSRQASKKNEETENLADLENSELDSLGQNNKNFNSNSATIETASQVNQLQGTMNSLLNCVSKTRGSNNLENEKSGSGVKKFEACANNSNIEFDGFGIEVLSCSHKQKKACLVNGSGDVFDGSSNVRRLNVGLLSYEQDREQKKWPLNDERAGDSEGSRRRSNTDVFELCEMFTDSDRFRKGLVYKRDGRRKKWQLDEGSSVALSRFGRELLCYKRTRFRKATCQVNGSIGVYNLNSGEGLRSEWLTYKRDKSRNKWISAGAQSV
ncbi:uncharacterized protein LOC127252719 [Andrographis paniculata]|uniref:uncharacterized protein LOC127252719 n=1 Tax=Andrographis paniculata TaxID=175694 RepID=UPI0021E8AFD0|nr:uncharacterized protein LOC127252719 [Andrographis paniculata]XP_051132977.1 uncharacterized protein LOC127252719 [Andrographis paniculata]